MPTMEDGLGQQRGDHSTRSKQSRAAAANPRDLALLLGEGLQAELIYPLLEAGHSDDRMPSTPDANMCRPESRAPNPVTSTDSQARTKTTPPGAAVCSRDYDHGRQPSSS